MKTLFCFLGLLIFVQAKYTTINSLAGEDVLFHVPDSIDHTKLSGFTWWLNHEEGELKNLISKTFNATDSTTENFYEEVFSLGENGIDLILKNVPVSYDGKFFSLLIMAPKIETIQFKLVVYQPPKDLLLSVTTQGGNMIFNCATDGGAKPSVGIKAVYQTKFGKSKVLSQSNIEQTTKDELTKTKLVAIMAIDLIELEDEFICEASSKEMNLTMTRNVTMVAPTSKYSTYKHFGWLPYPLLHASYSLQPEVLTTPGSVRIVATPLKAFYEFNETLLFSIQSFSNNFSPIPTYLWYDGNDEKAKFLGTSQEIEYTTSKNTTVYCVLENSLGSLVLSIPIPVKQESTALSIEQSSIPVFVGVIIAVAALICFLLIILTIIYVNKRRQQKNNRGEYTVSPYDDVEDIHMEMEKNTNDDEAHEEVYHLKENEVSDEVQLTNEDEDNSSTYSKNRSYYSDFDDQSEASFISRATILVDDDFINNSNQPNQV